VHAVSHHEQLVDPTATTNRLSRVASRTHVKSKHINWSFAISTYRGGDNNGKRLRYKLSSFWWQCL